MIQTLSAVLTLSFEWYSQILQETKEHYKRQCEALTREMGSLGPEFFEEVEDMKFALHHALKRNRQLEDALLQRSEQLRDKGGD